MAGGIRHALDAGLGGVGLLHELVEPGEGGVGADAGDAHGDRPVQHHRAAGDGVAGAFGHRAALARQHGLIQAGAAAIDHAVGGHLLAGRELDHVAQDEVGGRNLLLRAVAADAGGLGARAEEVLHRGVDLALGGGLGEAAEHDQEQEHGQAVEVNWPARGEAPDAREVGGDHAQRDQHVHAELAALDAGPCAAEERHGREAGRGGADDHAQVAQHLPHGHVLLADGRVIVVQRLGDEHGGDRAERGHRQSPQPELVREAHGLLGDAGVVGTRAIPGALDGLDEGVQAGFALAPFHLGAAGGQLHAGGGDARHTLEGALDDPDARAAVHALDEQVGRRAAGVGLDGRRAGGAQAGGARHAGRGAEGVDVAEPGGVVVMAGRDAGWRAEAVDHAADALGEGVGRGAAAVEAAAAGRLAAGQAGVAAGLEAAVAQPVGQGARRRRGQVGLLVDVAAHGAAPGDAVDEGHGGRRAQVDGRGHRGERERARDQPALGTVGHLVTAFRGRRRHGRLRRELAVALADFHVVRGELHGRIHEVAARAEHADEEDNQKRGDALAVGHGGSPRWARFRIIQSNLSHLRDRP
ncbi:hypothetical protein D3C72_853040 [compost metagenome]